MGFSGKDTFQLHVFLSVYATIISFVIYFIRLC